VRTLLLLCVVMLVPACAPHKVRCEGRLEPINVPAPPRDADAHVAGRSNAGVP
jgi:hypothetical protein